MFQRSRSSFSDFNLITTSDDVYLDGEEEQSGQRRWAGGTRSQIGCRGHRADGPFGREAEIWEGRIWSVTVGSLSRGVIAVREVSLGPHPNLQEVAAGKQLLIRRTGNSSERRERQKLLSADDKMRSATGMTTLCLGGIPHIINRGMCWENGGKERKIAKREARRRV